MNAMDKKAQNLSITTIIIAILAVLVLVILVLFFTGSLDEIIRQIRGQTGAYRESDVISARNFCNIFCSNNDQASFCTHVSQLENQETRQIDSKKCWEDPINAQQTAECRLKQYTQSSCSEFG